MRVIDFRVRPPYGSFVDLIVFRDPDRTARLARELGFELAPSVRERSMKLLIEEMDTVGCRIGVITGRTGTVFGSIENREIEKVIQAYPGRFVGAAYLPPHDHRTAFAEIERAVRAGFRAVVLEPGLAQPPMQLDDARLYPVYARLEEGDLPVIFMGGGNAGPDLTYTSPEHIDRVARDFPGLRVVLAHGGWPWTSEILHVCYRRPNVYLSPDMYLFGGMPGARAYVDAANGFMADRMLFGSAYPVLPVPAAVERFLKFPIREDVADRLLYANAASLLGLE